MGLRAKTLELSLLYSIRAILLSGVSIIKSITIGLLGKKL